MPDRRIRCGCPRSKVGPTTYALGPRAYEGGTAGVAKWDHRRRVVGPAAYAIPITETKSQRLRIQDPWPEPAEPRGAFPHGGSRPRAHRVGRLPYGVGGVSSGEGLA